MLIDIPLDDAALPTAGNQSGFGLCGYGDGAHETNDQNLHIRLTNILVAGVFQLHFPKNIPDAGGKLLALEIIQNAKLPVEGSVTQQFHAANAQHDIFQGLRIEAGFRMGYIGIDEDQVVHIYGIDLTLDQELPFAAGDEKQLRIRMGMKDGMPVAAIFTARNIQQFYVAANAEGPFLPTAIIRPTHKAVSSRFMYIGIITRKIALCNIKAVNYAENYEKLHSLFEQDTQVFGPVEMSKITESPYKKQYI